MRFHLSTTASLAAGALLLAPAASAQIARDAVRLNTTGLNLNGDNSIHGAVCATDGRDFYAAWTDQFGTNEFTQDIYFARSTDDGRTWSAPLRIDTGDMPNEYDSDFPKMAVADNGNIVVIWEERRDAEANGSASEDVFYNVSTDGGLTWLPAAQPLNSLSAGSNVTSDIDRIWISSDGNTFHVTWEEDSTLTPSPGGSEEVFYVRSADGGLTWSAPVDIQGGNFAADVDEPKVEASNGVAIIAYIDVNNDTVVHRSIDDGVTWSGPILVDTDTSGNADEAILDFKGDTVCVAWTEDWSTPGGEGVHCAVSTDAGATWRPEVVLSVQQEGIAGSDADSPKVVVQSANDIFVVYDEDSLAIQAGNPGGSGGNECYVSFTNDGGMTWTKDVPLNFGQVANRPYVVATSDVVVAWIEHNPNGQNIPAFIYSDDRGATWSQAFETPNAGPDIDEGAPRDEGVYVVISELTNTVVATHMDRPTGANEIYSSSFEIPITTGTNYCPSLPNSTGTGASMFAQGSRFVADNNLTLRALDLPQNAFGFFLVSQTQGLSAMPGGSQGNLCLGGSIGRYVGPGQIQNSGTVGEIELAIDLTQTPQPTGLVSITAGQTWNFTAWFRDAVGATSTSNFADGLSIDFQ